MTSTSPARQVLRKQLIEAREGLDPAMRAQFTGQIIGHLNALLEELQIQTLGFCWPYRGEVDLLEFLTRWQLAASGRTLALPVVPEKAGALSFHQWVPGEELVADRFGIPSPKGTPSVALQAVLIPVNGFDAHGYRIGYGGGFFDRTLASLQPTPLSIGIGFELARVDDVQPESHDLALDWIITEAGRVVTP